MNEILKTTRLLAGAMAGGSIMLWLVASYFSRAGGPQTLVIISALAGLVAPAIGYRIYRLIWERRPHGEREASAAFLRANIIALAVVEGASIVGAVGYLVTENPLACIGLFTQVLLTGAIWPNEPRLRSFLERGP